MKLLIASVHTKYFDGEAFSVTVPGMEGELTVLSNHMPLITTLKEGQIVVKKDAHSEGEVFPVASGILEVAENSATVLL